MKRICTSVLVTAILTAVPAGTASGQWTAGIPGEDVLSFGLHVGMLAPTSDLADGTSFESGTSIGLSLTWWPYARLGLQGFAFRSETEGVATPPTAASFHDPVVKGFSVGPAVRLPMSGGRFALAPYASAGIGAKHYAWAVRRPSASDAAVAFSLAGGIDIRPVSSPQFGLIVDVRNYRSDYAWHGFQSDGQTQNDIILAAGMSLNR